MGESLVALSGPSEKKQPGPGACPEWCSGDLTNTKFGPFECNLMGKKWGVICGLYGGYTYICIFIDISG